MICGGAHGERGYAQPRTPEDEIRFENLLPRQVTLCPIEKAGEPCQGIGAAHARTHGSRESHLGVVGEAMALLPSLIMGWENTLNPSTR